MKRVLHTITLFLILVAFFSTVDYGQEIKVQTELVTVPASVLDRQGRYVTDLSRSDFRIYEDGIEQDIEFFEPVENTINVFILLDVSGSVGKHSPAIADAASALVKQLRPADRVSVATFAYEFRTLIADRSISDINERVRIQQYPGDPGTMVYEAVETAASRLKKHRGRKAIIVFTDGVDTGVHLKLERALRNAEEQEANVYTLQYGLNDEPSRFVDRAKFDVWKANSVRYMRSVAETTGGRYFPIEGISNLTQTFSDIADELRHQYNLGYYPRVDARNGDRRTISVKVTRPGLIVRSRSSYVVSK